MKTTGSLTGAAWAVAGAAILGGGVVLGFASALVQRRETKPELAPPASPETANQRRADELARAVAALERRLEAAAKHRSDESTADRLDAVNLRIEKLEARMDQVFNESAAAPRIDQVLGVVEHMVASRVEGLDQRLDDQVEAIESLRNASTQTDVLLQRLLLAVEALSNQPPPEDTSAAAGA
jgi:sugar-specific transcriptional regulator TrmB